MPLDQLEQAIKAALLSGDRLAVDTLKGIKTALQYEAVAKQKKMPDLSEDEITAVLQRELKKRREAADLYVKAGSDERAEAEQKEAAVISRFLPKQLSDEELQTMVATLAGKMLGGGSPTMQDMGKIIGAVKQEAGASADGAAVARIVKAYIESSNK